MAQKSRKQALSSQEWRPKTTEIHGGETRRDTDIRSGVARVTAFPLRSFKRAERIFEGTENGFVYSRINNPTVDRLEKRLAAMEGAESALATSSGMSAIALLVQALAHGGHVVSSNRLYGGVFHLFADRMPKLGIEVTFVEDPHDIQAWEKAIRPNTKLLYVESPSNPLIDVFDIAALADVAHRYGALCAVDSTLATPVLLRPIELGADFVVHSASKYMGNGEVIGGCILGKEVLIDEIRLGWFRDTGPCLSPDNAAILLSNLESLSARVLEHCRNAEKLADFLAKHPKVCRVHYPTYSPCARVNTLLMPRGFGGLLAFDVVGGMKSAKILVEKTDLFWLAANIGEARSLIIHPATTTHGQMSAPERKHAGISNGTIRCSVGREDPDDLIEDLDRVLALI